MFAGSLSASTRRAFVICGLATLLCASSSLRAQQAPADDPFKFSSDFGQLVFQIKPEKAADFESAWTTIKDKLTKSDKAEWKELGDSIKVFKVDAGAPAAGAPPPNAVYIFYFSPPSKTLTYEPVKILYDSKLFERAEADSLYKKISEGFAGLSKWPMAKVIG